MNIKVAAFTVSEKSSNIIMHTVSDNITSTEILATITISQIRSLLYVSENYLHFLTMFTCFAIVAVIVVTKRTQVLLNLLNELRKRDKMRGLPSIFISFSQRV